MSSAEKTWSTHAGYEKYACMCDSTLIGCSRHEWGNQGSFEKGIFKVREIMEIKDVLKLILRDQVGSTACITEEVGYTLQQERI